MPTGISSSGQADKWQSIASWAETNIIPWRSRLVVGQTSTDNSVFDSVQFRGVQLGTDVEMRPSSQTGFAPVIRGVANSNARVEVRQNNYLIYSENVPAGPFELNDISAVNRSGDFYVTVIEADGSQTTFTVAYTTPCHSWCGQANGIISCRRVSIMTALTAMLPP